MHKKTKRYNQIIAINLIEKMKEVEMDPPQITGFIISRMLYLLSLILSNKQDKHPGAYSVLNMRYMLKVVPAADEYLNFLKVHKIIEWKNYCAGRNSRLYRLVEEGPTEYRTITDLKLIYRIEKNRLNIKRRNSKKYPALNAFIHKVRIDSGAAIKTVDSEYIKNINLGKENAESRRTFSLCEIEKINSGDIYIKVNSTNQRLDSNYTRLPGELLEHLTIDGQPLVEIDIRNSQLFFAAALFDPTLEVHNVMNRVLGRSLTMLAISLHISEYKDVKLYSSLVIGGDFYEFMMDKFKEDGIKYGNRDDVKRQMFIVFFCKNHSDRYNRAARLFSSLFPNVQRLFDTIKENKYNLLSILLQNIESYTILERVAQKILSDLPELPFITRHDSLLPSGIMVYQNVDKVKKIMLQTIEEVTGLVPETRIKGKCERLPYQGPCPNISKYIIISSNIIHTPYHNVSSVSVTN